MSLFAAGPSPSGDDGRKREANWGEIASVIRRQGSESDRTLFEDALLRWALLNRGSNPLDDSTSQILDPNLGRIMFAPTYQADLCHQTFSHGVFVQRVLLGELARLGPHPEEWLDWNERFAHLTVPLVEAARPAMEEWIRVRRQERVRRGRRKDYSA